MSAVADVKGIGVAGSRVDICLNVEDGEPWRSTVAISFELDSGLSEREQTILVNAGKSCDVSRMLAGSITINTKMSSGAARHPLPPRWEDQQR